MDMTGATRFGENVNAHFHSLGWIQICLYTTSRFHLRIHISYSSTMACLQGFRLAESGSVSSSMFTIRPKKYFTVPFIQPSTHPSSRSIKSHLKARVKHAPRLAAQFFVNLFPSILVCLLQLSSCYVELELQRNLASSVGLSVVDFT